MSPQSSPVFSPSSITSFDHSQKASPVTNNTSQSPSCHSTITFYIGISQIPFMIGGFFNQRHKTRSGAEAAYSIVMKMSQPVEVESREHQRTWHYHRVTIHQPQILAIWISTKEWNHTTKKNPLIPSTRRRYG